jgi:hypothetical protein
MNYLIMYLALPKASCSGSLANVKLSVVDLAAENDDCRAIKV